MQKALEKTTAQRLEALALANEIRSYRAQVKYDVAAGRCSPDHLIRAAKSDPQLATMKVMAALLVMPKIGRVKARKAMKAAGLASPRMLGSLSERERKRLLDAVYAYPAFRECVAEYQRRQG